jgi:hypothetical protein
MKRTYGKYAERTGWGDPYVLSTLAPGQDTFERIEGTIRSLGIFNPFNHFGNVPLRDQNDPNLRVHENDSKFGQE